MEHDPKGAGGGPGEPQEEFSIAHSNALIPLLVVFSLIVGVVLASIIFAGPAGHGEGMADKRAYTPKDFVEVFGKDEALVGLEDGADGGPHKLFMVPRPPFTSDSIFPCMDCHETMDPNPTRRKLVDEHDTIVLTHDSEHRWCLDCHDLKDRNMLHLSSGELVDFTESYRLCGQCHGTQYRDWRSGIHGKRTGYWAGAKRYLLCVHCHNPHSPRFAPLTPLPAPVRPQLLRESHLASAVAAPAVAPAKEPMKPTDDKAAHGDSTGHGAGKETP
ncbi:MAG: hypothetical protein HY904_05575 [Deltaproteobacteria bacterium]|nr:hypothetical protein [Deltaproteobacteria bacterium]